MKKCFLSIFAALLLSLSAALYFADNGAIKANVHIENIPVGGLTKAEAEAIFKPFISPFEGVVCISAGAVSKTVSFSDLELCHDYQLAVEKAYNIGREKNIFARMKSLYENRHFGTYIPAAWTWNEEKAKAFAEEIASLAYYPSYSAEITIDEKDGIKISDSYYGLAVNTEYSIENVLLSQIAKGKWQLKTENIPPAISSEDAAAWGINGIIASYKTKFDNSQKERTQNMRLAAGYINDTLIMPGEEFSFNETTGPRTAALGYQEAYIILNDKFELGLGGGVCQVSSTLYNAVLLAGLPVTERFPHSLEVTYVPKGKDAAVSYGTLDFKFINSLDAPIIVHIEFTANILTVSLFTHLT